MAKKTAFDRIHAQVTHALKGQGMIYTPLGEVDHGKFRHYMYADDAAWLQNQGWPMGRNYQSADVLEFYTTVQRARGTSFEFLVQREPDGPYIGEATVFMRPHTREASIGYFVIPSERGKGVATEIAETLKGALEGSAKKFGIRAVSAEVLPGNVLSERVLEKSGFECKGLQDSKFPESRGRKHLLYSSPIARER